MDLRRFVRADTDTDTLERASDTVAANQFEDGTMNLIRAEHGDHLHLVGRGCMPIDALRERFAAAGTAHLH